MVLLLDDDPLITRSLIRALKAKGIDAMASSRSIGFLSLVRKHRPRLVILDYSMPGLDGSQVGRLIREDRDLTQTQIILYSAAPEAELTVHAEACEADAWLPKSTDFDTTISTFVRWARREERLPKTSRARFAALHFGER